MKIHLGNPIITNKTNVFYGGINRFITDRTVYMKASVKRKQPFPSLPIQSIFLFLTQELIMYSREWFILPLLLWNLSSIQ